MSSIISRAHYVESPSASSSAAELRAAAAPSPGLLRWQVIHDRMPWSLVLLLGGGFALARATQVSGLSAWMGAQLAVLDFLDARVLVLIVCAGTAVATEVTSNVATCSILLPVLRDLVRTPPPPPRFAPALQRRKKTGAAGKLKNGGPIWAVQLVRGERGGRGEGKLFRVQGRRLGGDVRARSQFVMLVLRASHANGDRERDREREREGASLRCMAFGLPSSSALLEESQQRMTTGTQPFEQMNSDRPAELEPS